MNKKLLPHFLIIGAPKCGTTALHYYLSQHPELNLSPKEAERRAAKLFTRDRKCIKFYFAEKPFFIQGAGYDGEADKSGPEKFAPNKSDIDFGRLIQDRYASYAFQRDA